MPVKNMELAENDWSDWQPLNSIAEVVDPRLDGPGVFEIRLAEDGEPLPFPRSGGLEQQGVVFIGSAADSLRSQLGESEGTIQRDRLSRALTERRYSAPSTYDGESAHPGLWPEFSVECRWAASEEDQAPEIADGRLILYLWLFGDYPPLNETPDVPEDPDAQDFNRSFQLDLDAWQDRPGRQPDNPIVYCAHVGLVSKDRFGWTRSPELRAPYSETDQSNIGSLARRVADDLAEGLAVALGFECPLFIPVRDKPEEMRKARNGEGNRPWSAATGLGSLNVGLSQTLWLLRMSQTLLEGTGRAFLDWNSFLDAGKGLFVWEAFVSGDANPSESDADSDAEDPAAAVWSFVDALPTPEDENAIEEDSVHSLIGAALLRTGWSDDVELLSTPCLVLRS